MEPSALAQLLEEVVAVRRAHSSELPTTDISTADELGQRLEEALLSSLLYVAARLRADGAGMRTAELEQIAALVQSGAESGVLRGHEVAKVFASSLARQGRITTAAAEIVSHVAGVSDLVEQRAGSELRKLAAGAQEAGEIDATVL